VSRPTRADAREFLAFAGRHRIEVTAMPYPFDRADRALADLAADRVNGAAVLRL
jgi:alcohol dehydrogenase, propanol-preferring